ncbi:MAG: hypothetical protein AUJ97_03980 [Bacteroidetes bacterium CG2_30_32_10]|nr:MAG: hypothetical protein AUJ97_03980 [Bacteroidetes bacterium CG2_30_32_10]
MRIRILLVIFSTFIWVHSFSGNYDSTYVKRFTEKFTIKCGISTKNISFTLSPIAKSDSLKASSIIYRPNVYSYFNIGGSWKFLSGSISFKIPKGKDNVQLHGKTNYADFRLSLIKKRFAASAFLKTYQGFYINDPNKVFPEWQNGQPYPQRKDIYFNTIGLEGYYVFSWKKYSLNAAFRQGEKQLKHSGSFLLKGDLSYIGIGGDSSLIPYTQSVYYNEMKGLQSGDFLSGVISAGYTYVFTIGKQWFASPFLFSGIGYQKKALATNEQIINNKNFLSFLDFKMTGGYNGNNFFSTIILDAENYFMNEKEISFQTSGVTFDLNIGYRF